MICKRVCPCALVLTLLGLGVARGQYVPPPAVAEGVEAAPQPVGDPVPGRLSEWILYRQPDCCGPVGGSGPIGTELAIRNGVSLALPINDFAGALNNGWIIEGSGRVLFFNPEQDRAWTVELGLTHIVNQSHSPQEFELRDIIVPQASINQFTPNFVRIRRFDVTLASLNRTFAQLALGRQWWFGPGPANCARGVCCKDGAWQWRAGFDVGGRWGTAKLEMNELPHRNDAITGAFLGVHSDLEYPCGCCTFLAGGRFEWAYTWTDILQSHNPGEIADINLLLTLGVRY